MKKLLTFTLGIMTALIVTACASIAVGDSQRGEVTGSVSYRERIMLPPNATITVTLQDVSKADAKAEVISQHRFSAAEGSSPYPFTLKFDNSAIQEKHRYSVSARIEVDGNLLFITDTHYGVLTDPQQRNHVDLSLIKVN